MKYLTLFGTHDGYEEYMTGGEIDLPNVSLCEQENEVHYNPYVHSHDYSQDYFTMVVTTGGGNITWTGKSSNALSYSTNGGKTWSEASSNITLSVSEGDKVLWKGITTPGTTSPNSGIGTFSGDTDVRYSVEGNVMSLLFSDDFKGQTSLVGKDATFVYLFKNNTNVTNAENLSLPATTLAQKCYTVMFYFCTNLTTAPLVLPATTLASYCYTNMFSDCASLTTAPELPATTLADWCYSFMFKNCTSLTTAPELPATTLASTCYTNMFEGCTSLNSITCLATDISATNCTENWLKGVAANGTFTKAASMTSWSTGYRGIPSSWTVVDAS